MKKLISTMIILTAMTACIDPEVVEEVKDDNSIHGGGGKLVSQTANGGIAAKNFTQIHMTYSTLTGIPTYEDSINAEYKSIQLQLPASTDPESLNGFNQLSSTRLAFAYCDVYMEKGSKYSLFSSNSNSVNAKTLINQFADLDFENNSDHQVFLSEVVAILENKGVSAEGDEVQLLQTADKKKLLKLGCAAVLSSSYLTLI